MADKFNLEIDGKFKSTTKGNADWYYGGGDEAWATIQAAKDGVVGVVRTGKIVGVLENGKITEYMWHPEDITDNGLVLKNTSLPGNLVYTNIENTFTETNNFSKGLNIGSEETTEVVVATSRGFAPVRSVRVSDVLNDARASFSVTHKSTGRAVAGFGPEFSFMVIDNRGAQVEIGAISSYLEGSSLLKGALAFSTKTDAGATLKRMVISGDGKVIIGEISYAEDKLSIDGHIGNETVPTLARHLTNKAYVDSKSSLSTFKNQPEISAASYAVVSGDNGKVIPFTRSSSIALTINQNSLIESGDICYADVIGTGELTITAGTGVTLQVNSNRQLKSDGQFSRIAIHKVGSSTYRVFGELKSV